MKLQKMKKTLLMISFSIIMIAGCSMERNSDDGKNPPFVNADSLDLIIKEELANKVHALLLLHHDLKFIIDLREEPEAQKFYLGRVSTARQSLSTIVYLNSLTIHQNGEQSPLSIPIAEDLFSISEIGNKLSMFANKKTLDEQDYAKVNEIHLELSEIIKELESVLAKTQIIGAEYDREELESRMKKVKDLLDELVL